MTRPSPLEICHGELNRAPSSQQGRTIVKAQGLIPLGRHIKHIDQEPYCRSVQFSCKVRATRAGPHCVESVDERPRTRLRDGVDGFLQVIIKEPTNEDGQVKNERNRQLENNLYLDLFFLESSRQSREKLSSKRQRPSDTKSGKNTKRLDQCLKINNNSFNANDPTTTTQLDGDCNVKLGLRKAGMTVAVKTKNGGYKKRPAVSKILALELGNREGVKGVRLGPKTLAEEINTGEVKLPALGQKSATYAGLVGTLGSPRITSSEVSSTSSMYAGRAKRSNDVLWLTGTRPTYVLGDDSSPPRLPEGRRAPVPGTAKSAPPPVDMPRDMPLSSADTAPAESRTRSSHTRGTPRFLETEFGFNRDAFRENLGMTQQRTVPRGTTAVEKQMGRLAEKHIYSCQTASQGLRSSRLRQSVDGLRRTIYPVRGAPAPRSDMNSRSVAHNTKVPHTHNKRKSMGSHTDLNTLGSLPPIDGFNVPIYGQHRKSAFSTFVCYN